MFRVCLSVVIVFFLFSGVVSGQRLSEFIVTDADIQVRFLGAPSPGEGDWNTPPIISIEYSGEALTGEHIDKAKVGHQSWEFALQLNMEVFEKCIVIIDIPFIPYGMYRNMEIRVRVRSEASNGVMVSGPWSFNNLKLIGKPGKPVKP